MNIVNIFKNSQINKGHARSVNAKKNILFSFIIKGIDIAATMAIVPVTLNYLNSQDEYGIWLTLTSLTAWINFMNIGLGHGLRNRFAEAIAIGDEKRAKELVSTAYIFLSILVACGLMVFAIINLNINWIQILNIKSLENSLLIRITFYIFSLFGVLFVLRLINSILLAKQESAYSDFILMTGKVAIVISMLFLSKSSISPLISLTLIYYIAPIIIILLFTLYLFNSKLYVFRPSIKNFRLNLIKDLFITGMKFFIIQISVVILLYSDNFIISHYFGPEYVTSYQIAHKYFQVMIIIFTIIVTPFWSAITEAYQKNEIEWIKLSVKKLHYIWLLFIGMAIVMCLFSNQMYRIWIGDGITISLTLSIYWALFGIVYSLNMIYSHALNGIGILNAQVIISLGIIFVTIPLKIYLAKEISGSSEGVLLGTIVTLIIALIFRVIQYFVALKNISNSEVVMARI